jgi:hypothetical protein
MEDVSRHWPDTLIHYGEIHDIVIRHFEPKQGELVVDS